MAKGFEIGWASGSSAQIDLFSPAEKAKEFEYKLRYTPAFRSIFRRQPLDNPVTSGDLERTNVALEKLVDVLGARAKAAAAEPAGDDDAPKAPAPPPLKAVESETSRGMKKLGERLMDLIIPRALQSELRSPGLFIELGLDERLMSFPWELMYDGDFLCLKHSLGRFVNVEDKKESQLQVGGFVGKPLEKLKVLLISVPEPKARDETAYPPLKEARAETEEIIEAIAGDERVHLDLIEKPTFDNVVQKLKQGGHHIVHFNGHAHFDSEEPHNSGLVLLDQDMSAIDVDRYCKWNRDGVLYFINACETAATGALDDEAKSKQNRSRFDLLSLARAFMETGAYTLGSRWKINDKAARTFAGTFYRSLIENGEPIGRAIQASRRACSKDDEFAWASYVYYGDPRIRFQRRG